MNILPPWPENDEPVRPTRPAPEPRKPTRPAPIANALTSVAQAVAGVVATIADAVVGDEDGNYVPPKDPAFKRTKRAPTPFDPGAFDVQVHKRAQKAQSAPATTVSSTADAVAEYFGESMTTESEEEGKAIDKLEERQRIQRPDWVKFMVDNDMRITLDEFVNAENWAIEDFRDRHGDYPEEDDPEFQRMVLMRARWVTYNTDTGDNVRYAVFIEAYKHATRMFQEKWGDELKADFDDSDFLQHFRDYVDMATGK